MKKYLPAIFLTLFMPAVFANDSTAVIETWGIRFLKNTAVVMESERLSLSKESVTVDYVFRNETAQDVVETVDFPMPRRQSGKEVYLDWPYTDAVEKKFTVEVDGRKVAFQREVRALQHGKKGSLTDITAKLRGLGLSERDIETEPMSKATTRLLKKAGFKINDIEVEEGLLPWSVQVHYHWQQRFPAGKVTRVSHSYPAVLGGRIWDAKPDSLADLQKDYCLDNREIARLRKLNAQGASSELRYVLTTGANWAGPIRNFELTIHKGSPSDRISLCWPHSDFQRVSPTQLTTKIENFTPTQDLSLLYY